ncbi:ATP-dependent DNA ligase [Arthrobacter agilis]|uniref:ATP-dependent DNA ligase n=1 Tax=Arthrobacter agilis TaxID=37921 RepID=UPI000B34DF00|nr:ATP-dependent DNA ligase [Arthrobacter agilis]OUM41612.1 ATP-dependent DNA ligase [Arthrobacter agilis]PPB47221.1 ATP-dependent DNA ligase [Arthrobacter agilis]TPV26813.1 ATP-dependent DNA ligase [Arthrobacter agilis]VDR33077.1 Putative DNA ligase-like protein Rv0938/MT0965 [Arthrobacter agilis]
MTDLPFPLQPMLAKAVDAVPNQDSVPGGLVYEPKWDGFRAIVRIDGGSCEIGSRGSKMLTRYFPELVETLLEHLPERCVVDGEIIVRRGEQGAERLDWEALSQRIHPAESRVRLLAGKTPSSFVAFDLLALDQTDLTGLPFRERRRTLEGIGESFGGRVHLSQITRDVELARRWLVEFEGAGLDGVVAKPLAAAYEPNKRRMLKIKHHRSADTVVLGYRVHKSGQGIGSLLLGLYDVDGELRNVGGISAFSTKRRLELVEELEPDVLRDDDGEIQRGATERSRFASAKDVSYVRLHPRRVVEVRYDQMEGDRFRHTVQFERWRPDREARSCTFDQLDLPVAYDLRNVLA